MIRIVHISDLHVFSRRSFNWREIILTKRITGYVNLLLHRARVHRREYLEAVLAAVTQNVDHCVVTGDIVNLALESEYREAQLLLDRLAQSVEVTVVPGNHDIYLPSIARERRFPRYFRQFLHSDLPELACDLPVGPYPCVKLRGPLALIAVSSGVPRPPFVAAGRVGDQQRQALAAVLAHPEVVRRFPVILIHHPPVDGRNRLTQLRDGLVDGAAFRQMLAPLGHGLVLFGHIHVRVRCTLRTPAGSFEVVSASGAALDHPDPAVRAGFNRYEIEDDGTVRTIEAHVLNASGRGFERAEIPRRPECT